MRLLQLLSPAAGRRVGLVEGDTIRLLRNFNSIYALAHDAIARNTRLAETALAHASNESLPYDDVYNGSGWRILPAIDHPSDPSHCLVSGTGLTHRSSALSRDAMHAQPEALTDSMRMYQWGVEGGRPPQGAIGTAPEWFYKGRGYILKAHGEPLAVPPYAEDGGEEPEIAALYLVAPSGTPVRLGMTQGNEFSDHCLEKRNYLYLAASKLRQCSIGPELVLDPDFARVEGTVTIERDGKPVWSKQIASGEEVMCHSLANIEHHHFKYEEHRRPGDVHVHFLGASALSFSDGMRLADGDVMQVSFRGFGRPLRNPLSVEPREQNPVVVGQL